MTKDRNFDDLYERFRRNIKSNDKGRLRETLIRDDLLSSMPELEKGGREILDAGCGLGDMSLWLARMGNHVTATDIAGKMVEHAKTHAEQEGLSDRMTVSQRSVQDSLSGEKRYDLICIHAVMEWLAQPYDILAELSKNLKKGGCVSLTVYNLHRSIFSALIKGDMKMIEKGHFGGSPDSLTPPNPIIPERVRSDLEKLGFQVEIQAGLRCFFDYYSAKVREERSYDEVLFLERRYRKEPPYRDIARYVHFVARWP